MDLLMSKNWKQRKRLCWADTLVWSLHHLLKKEAQISSKKIFLGAHAIRIICNNENLGYPVPEGFHHDGFDYVSIISVNKLGINGGKSYLKNAKSKKIVFQKAMQKNEVLFFNDKRLMHYASPIKLIKGKIGFRDVIVLTFHE